MLILSVILFAVAALGGLVLGVLGLRQRGLPMWLSLIHGVVAAAGLITLILGVVQGNAGITCDYLIGSIPHRCTWRIRAVFLPFTPEATS